MASNFGAELHNDRTCCTYTINLTLLNLALIIYNHHSEECQLFSFDHKVYGTKVHRAI